MASPYKIAAVHAAPVYMDKEATTDKIDRPFGLSRSFLTRVPTISLGFSERISGGTALFNSQIFINSKGSILGVHRKLLSTLGERIVWAQDGGKSLRAYASNDGYVIGGLLCSENSMNGAHRALLEDGEQIHVGAWPALSAIAAQADGVFAIAVSDFADERCLNWIKENLGHSEHLVQGGGGGWSAIVHPNATYLAGPHTGPTEKFVQCEIDLSHISISKVLIDAIGHYKRPEI
ncbi:hypothetical protein BBP40_004093 [Aspergillus hancockii]|nr:hypothetical protein BBP40_004093 [Aspergillus hancockii]